MGEAEKTKNLLVVCDVDGVILNFSRGIKRHVMKEFDVYLSEDPVDWNMGVGDDISIYLKSFWRSDDFSRLELIKDDWQSIAAALDICNVKLIFLTNVPEYALAKRIANMESVGLSGFPINAAADKSAVIESILPDYDAVLLIDDKTENVLSALDIYGVTVTYPVRGYNYNALKLTAALPYSNTQELFNIIVEWAQSSTPAT